MCDLAQAQLLERVEGAQELLRALENLAKCRQSTGATEGEWSQARSQAEWSGVSCPILSKPNCPQVRRSSDRTIIVSDISHTRCSSVSYRPPCGAHDDRFRAGRLL